MPLNREDVLLKHRGAFNELAACQWLLAQGYEVFRNVSQCGLIDIVALRGDEILKIDVKTGAGKWQNGYGTLRPQQRGMGIVTLAVFEDGSCKLNRTPGVMWRHGEAA